MKTNAVDRTYPIAAAPQVGPAQVGAGNEVNISIPANALLLRITVATVQAFDGTSPKLTVKDDATTFANAVDLSDTGFETVSGAPKLYPTGGKLTVSLTGSDVTKGLATVVPEYVRIGNNIAGVQE